MKLSITERDKKCANTSFRETPPGELNICFVNGVEIGDCRDCPYYVSYEERK